MAVGDCGPGESSCPESAGMQNAGKANATEVCRETGSMRMGSWLRTLTQYRKGWGMKK